MHSDSRKLYFWEQSSSFICGEATCFRRSVAFPQTFISFPSSLCSGMVLQRARYFYIGLFFHSWKFLLKGVHERCCYPELKGNSVLCSAVMRVHGRASATPLSLLWMTSFCFNNDTAATAYAPKLLSQSCHGSQHHSLRFSTSQDCSSPPQLANLDGSESPLFLSVQQYDNWGNYNQNAVPLEDFAGGQTLCWTCNSEPQDWLLADL